MRAVAQGLIVGLLCLAAGCGGNDRRGTTDAGGGDSPLDATIVGREGGRGSVDAAVDGGGEPRDGGMEVDARPAGSPGAPCADGSECDSSFCVDGVCCNEPCDGVCEQCDLAGAVGTCSASPPATDPDGDCGTTEYTTCRVACTGERGVCGAPPEGSTCAPDACSRDGARVLSYRCDDRLYCGATTTVYCARGCDPATAACRCTGHADCEAGEYCDMGECRALIETGEPCASMARAHESCRSGFCEDDVCCESECDTLSSCETDVCLCNGERCGADAFCVEWHPDLDGDGHAGYHPSMTIVACSDSPPSAGGLGYSYSPDDCYDDNPDVFPGQIEFFGVERGDGSFDYDCDGTEETLYEDDLGDGPCVDCGYRLGGACTWCTYSALMPAAGQTYGLRCRTPDACDHVETREGFRDPTPCGATSTLTSCVRDCSGDEVTTAGVQQRCR